MAKRSRPTSGVHVRSFLLDMKYKAREEGRDHVLGILNALTDEVSGEACMSSANELAMSVSVNTLHRVGKDVADPDTRLLLRAQVVEGLKNAVRTNRLNCRDCLTPRSECKQRNPFAPMTLVRIREFKAEADRRSMEAARARQIEREAVE